jgi:hypothetical protein
MDEKTLGFALSPICLKIIQRKYDLLPPEPTIKRLAHSAILHNTSEVGAKNQFGTISGI